MRRLKMNENGGGTFYANVPAMNHVEFPAGTKLEIVKNIDESYLPVGNTRVTFKIVSIPPEPKVITIDRQGELKVRVPAGTEVEYY